MAALSSEEARQQARVEGLVLRVAKSKSGYFGVSLAHPPSKSYSARMRRGRDGRAVNLGLFATAEEAALCVARSPEGRASAEKAAAVEQAAAALPPLSEEQLAAQTAKLARKAALQTAGRKRAREASLKVAAV